ncbi:hypothetical protein BDV26DRAFT_298290 [Aspergillus bertholletiae]|uniref:HNH nuclease domain-containing protein n=1 Tax=Aspergillus bertholletiae TaxID=1226010 RepID=A0A5N7ASG7_9EURO|nr:hypothetical protein BDV26DRAFT_298290 [Aspergillus bertholletiae]
MDIDPPTPTHARVGRSGTIIGPVPRDENFNEVCSQRQQLLDRLHQIIQRAVPRAFWAVLIFSDIEMLEKFICECEKSTFLLDFCMHACAAIPLLWAQKPPRPPSSESSSATTSSPTPANRRQKIINLALERDGKSCLFRKTQFVDVAHIYPHYLLADRRTNFSTTLPPFWGMLEYFWPPEKVKRWHDKIFTNPTDPSRQVDSVFNTMCISPDIHRMWSTGICAFRPLDYNSDKTTIEVEWHWQPARTVEDRVAVNTVPASSRNMEQVTTPNGLLSELFLRYGDSVRFVKTGDKFTFSTTDPETMPLPSKELLEMAFILTRIVNLSGAVDPTDLVRWDSLDGDAPETHIPRWLASISGEESEKDSDGSSDVDSNGDNEGESDITSGYPSLARIRERVQVVDPTEMEQALSSTNV